MLRFVMILALLAFTSVAAPFGRGEKAVVEVLELAARRETDRINVDCKVRNRGTRKVAGLTVVFRFEDSAGKVITTQRMRMDESLEPEGEGSLEAQMKDAPRAVQLHVLCVDGQGLELRVTNDGPFSID